ncbi:FlaA1/EpsC-like NDP-sugar epimerase [Arcticibacter pallidicorallinus]|uniref:FlaA1/EpsC-like NDP-sugar epimerase n=1 Tax=Arcticibacter pallidicorallinus TaxID=1259464 RepID=A0A2T0TRP5_9SPHI|nr:nucleoside-diphosphate sugar epimerase/dehydratase [Arcticibacter pallidicorallinus]PRY48303.1 FlaA1/EpsC-like NDP-sugar epimerase [Arcticibacter pallidicorallinus]
MKKIFYTEKAYSRWLILMVDQLIVTWALLISFLMANRFEYQEFFTSESLWYVGLYSLIAIVVFVTMRIHTGIIRYSSTDDMFRVLMAVTLTSIFFGVTSKLLVLPKLHLIEKWLNIALIFNFFISTSLLIIFRISIKHLFEYLRKDFQLEQKKEVVLIYGSDSASILIKNALESGAESDLKVLGFVDDKQDKVNKSIERKKVYASSQIGFLKSKFSVGKLVVMENHTDVEGMHRAINICIEKDIKVVSVPPSRQWLDGRLSLNQFRALRIEDLLEREPIVLNKSNIYKELRGKRVLVTGAAGSIGSEVVRQVLSYNPKYVVLFDQAETPLHELQLELEDNFLGSLTRVFMGSIQNEKRLRQMFDLYRPEMIFHAAACKHVPMMESNPMEAVSTNVSGTRTLADLAVEYRVDKFVMISTDKAVNPTNVMGASKRIAEMYTQSLSHWQPFTKFITTRFGNVLGSNGSVVPRFKSQIEQGGPITITHPDITRYFMTIPEAVQLVLEASAIGNGGEIFIFDMGKPVRIFDLAVNMIKLAGLVPEKDIQIVCTGLRPGEKLFEELLNKEEYNIPTDNAKIKISKVIHHDFNYIRNELEELVSLASASSTNQAIVRKMKDIVPEFNSTNSLYKGSEAVILQ